MLVIKIEKGSMAIGFDALDRVVFMPVEAGEKGRYIPELIGKNVDECGLAAIKFEDKDSFDVLLYQLNEYSKNRFGMEFLDPHYVPTMKDICTDKYSFNDKRWSFNHEKCHQLLIKNGFDFANHIMSNHWVSYCKEIDGDLEYIYIHLDNERHNDCFTYYDEEEKDLDINVLLTELITNRLIKSEYKE